MNDQQNYYGSDKVESVSYLEFGSVDIAKKSKTIWGYWQDQEAYDLYMFSRYARDMYAFRRFLSGKDRTLAELKVYVENSAHVKLLDYIFKYAGLLTCIDVLSGGIACESGSSLYGLLEEAMACDAVFHDGKNIAAIQNMEYVASDISELMNWGAKTLHPKTTVHESIAPTLAALAEDITGRLGLHLSLFYGLSVSIRYAVRTATDLVRMADISDLSVYNRLSLSYGETFSNVYGTGKTVYVPSLPEFIEGLERARIHAKYCTANMQYERDGKNSVRASVIVSRDEKKLDTFIKHYEDCIRQAGEYVSGEKGEWLDLCVLQDRK